MKKLLAIISFPVMILACSQAPSYTIEASIEGLSDGMVYLKQRGASGWDTVDSTQATGGKFTFNGAVTTPEQYVIMSGETVRVPLFIENSKITVAGKAAEAKSITVTGSKVQDEYKAFVATTEALGAEQEAIYNQYKEARQKGDTSAMKPLEAKIDSLDGVMNNQNKKFILENGSSFIAPVILQSVQYGMEADELQSFVSKFSPEVMQSKAAKNLAERVALLQTVAVGQIAPDFTMNDSIGTPVKLSDIYSKNELTLVDFWASWCGPCRRENPNVVKTFAEYNGKGFTVLGVSCDSDKAKWLKAVKDDKLTWNHVSDLKGWGNEAAKLYGVNSIPSNLLVDKTGKIIAKNLREEKLRETIAGLLK